MSNTPTARVLPKGFCGFDLGDGETSVSWQPAGRSSKNSIDFPEMIKLVEESPNWMTAYCENADGTLGKFGIEALSDACRLAGNIPHSNFKERPDRNPEARRKLRTYAELIVGEVQSRTEYSAEHILCVGCPSGWEESSKICYRESLEQLHPNVLEVTIIKESRAAMLQAIAEARDQMSKDSGIGNALVIDVGSSTLDFTVIMGDGSRFVDHGVDLGAKLIDQAILERAELWMHDPQTLAEIRAAKGKVRTLLLAVCRQAKERYFSKIVTSSSGVWRIAPVEERGNFDGQSDRFSVPLDSGKMLKVTCTLESAIVDAIIATPIASLGGLTWPQAFRKALVEVKRDMLQNVGELHHVILVGGAARMDCVQEITREEFDGKPILKCSNPSTFISKGLARAGERSFLIQQFEKDVDLALNEYGVSFSPQVDKLEEEIAKLDAMKDECYRKADYEGAADLGSKVDELQKNKVSLLSEMKSNSEPAIKKQFERYKNQLADELAAAMFNEAILVELDYWKRGINDSIERTERDIKDRIRKWAAGDRPKAIWKQRTDQLFTDIKSEWSSMERVRQACRNVGINPDDFAPKLMKAPTTLPDEDIPPSISQASAFIDQVEGIVSDVVGSMAAILVAVIAVMKLPLIAMGPVGWAVIALLALAGQRGAVWVLRTQDLPSFLREWMMDSNRIYELKAELIPKISRSIQSSFTTDVEAVRPKIQKAVRSCVTVEVDNQLRYLR